MIPNKGEDLATLRPNLALEWHPTKNGDLTPDMFKLKSNKRVWWKCANGHEWNVPIVGRSTKGTRCPYCIGKLKWPQDKRV